VPALRIHVVDYLNAWPLAWGLRTPAEGLEVAWTTPAACADALASGEADVGLIPSVECQRIAGLVALPGHCVACRGPVESVRLYARVPWEEVRRVALDETSRTSAELARLVLGWRGARVEETFPAPQRLEGMLEGADAALLIGDEALRAGHEGLRTLDLGEAWRERTGLPFVFAFWAARGGTDAARAARVLRESAAAGLASLEEVAAAGAEARGLEPERVLAYLRDRVAYELGEAEREGLERFYRELGESGALETVRPLAFAGEPARGGAEVTR
jgi:chorismate dehydratase